MAGGMVEGEGEYVLVASGLVAGPGLDVSSFLAEEDGVGGGRGPLWTVFAGLLLLFEVPVVGVPVSPLEVDDGALEAVLKRRVPRNDKREREFALLFP